MHEHRAEVDSVPTLTILLWVKRSSYLSFSFFLILFFRFLNIAFRYNLFLLLFLWLTSLDSSCLERICFRFCLCWSLLFRWLISLLRIGIRFFSAFIFTRNFLSIFILNRVFLRLITLNYLCRWRRIDDCLSEPTRGVHRISLRCNWFRCIINRLFRVYLLLLFWFLSLQLWILSFRLNYSRNSYLNGQRLYWSDNFDLFIWLALDWLALYRFRLLRCTEPSHHSAHHLCIIVILDDCFVLTRFGFSYCDSSMRASALRRNHFLFLFLYRSGLLRSRVRL